MCNRLHLFSAYAQIQITENDSLVDFLKGDWSLFNRNYTFIRRL